MSNYKLLIHCLLVDSLLLLCFATFAFGANRLSDDEVQALKDIAKILGKKDWNFIADPCSGSEYGWITPADKYSANNVTCGNCTISDAANATSSDQICHVVSIVLKAQNLTGKLPPELIRLPYLQEIDLSRNYLNGTIPREWGSLPLVNISLIGNRFTGSIPVELANISTLKSLAIDFNSFFGVLPPELGNLPNIERMRLTSNNFAGELPKTFARLTKLKDFRISDNSFFGKIPNFIQNWTNLEKLVIQGSGLMGPFPSGISLLTNLTDLRITDLNGLGSPLPQLNNIKMLKTLMLRNCNISGLLPTYLGAMKKLKILDLSFNKLTGEIPISFSGLAMVDYMFLTGNMLNGSVPSWLQRSNIDLSYNDFTIDQGGLNLFAISSGRDTSSVSCPKSEKCPKLVSEPRFVDRGWFAMASSSSSHFRVEQFDGKNNFTLWQRRVKDILVQQGLAKPLKGKDAQPEKMKDEEWDELESRCVSTIRLFIADNIINNINDEDSAPKLWERMEKLYLGKGLQTKLNLKRDLYKLKMGEGASLVEHLNVFKGLLAQLTRVEVKIEEEDQALLLLTSLPDSYENIITTILYGKDTLKVEDVESTLLSHEKRKKADDSQGSIFVTHGQNQRGRSIARGSSEHSRSKSRGKGKSRQCYKCKEWGHIRPDCPLLKEKDNKGPDNSMTGVVELSNDFGEFLTVSKGNYTCSQNDWILDTGSSHHLCSRKEYFDTFQEIQGFVTWGDGTRRSVMGIGTVKIKMFDGAVRTLGDVVYVPRFRRNLISLSQLDSKGCRMLSAGGVVKISRGCMVLMKGEKCGGMFRLIGKTQTSKVARKRCAKEKRYQRQVSFAGTAEMPSTCFQVSDDGEKEIPAGEGVKSRSLFEGNL